MDSDGFGWVRIHSPLKFRARNPQEVCMQGAESMAYESRVDPFPPSRSARLRSDGESDSDRILLIGCHLWPFIGLITGMLPLLWIGVIVVWAVRKDDSPLIADQGRELLNVLLTFIILAVIPVIGWIALVIWIPVMLVNAIRAAIAAGRSEYFRYPLVIRFIT